MEVLLKMTLPDDAIELIKMQRSNYDKKRIKKKFSQDIEKDFNEILSFLPEQGKVKTIVDIGCGLGGISVLLSHYYDYPELYLVDKNQVSEKVKYGFHENESFYNSFDVLKKILEMNYIKNYNFVQPENDFKEIKNVDIVISLLAMGFHFPLYFYFGRIFRCLSKTGIFICDIRKTQYEDQIKLVKLYFKNIKEIQNENLKTRRICAKEKIWRA